MQVATWARTYGVKMSDPERADTNPIMPDSDMPAGSSHWRITLRCHRRSMVVYFSQGPAFSHEPSMADVLSCLASDSAGIENAPSFEEWCAEYGYDTDSRRAENTYRAVRVQTNSLRRLLAGGGYQDLLYCVFSFG